MGHGNARSSMARRSCMRRDESRDADAIADIVARARRAVARVADLSFDEFANDEDVQDVVVRCLEVIGEAAGRVSDSGRAAHSGVPWTPMSGMRNRLVHDYGNMDLEEVWRAVTEDLPRLIVLLSRDLRA